MVFPQENWWEEIGALSTALHAVLNPIWVLSLFKETAAVWKHVENTIV